MLRVRTAKGQLVELPADAAAIEICSSDGKLCHLLIPGKDGDLVQLSAEDEAFRNYAKAIGVPVAQLINLKNIKKLD